MRRHFFAKNAVRATPTLPVALAATSAKSIVESLQNIANAEVQNQLPIATSIDTNSNAGAWAHAGFSPRYVPGVAADPSESAHKPKANQSIALGRALELGNSLKRRWISDRDNVNDGDAYVSIMDPHYVRAHAIAQESSAHAHADHSIASSELIFPDPGDDHDQLYAYAQADAFAHAHAGHGYANVNANPFDHDYNYDIDRYHDHENACACPRTSNLNPNAYVYELDHELVACAAALDVDLDSRSRSISRARVTAARPPAGERQAPAS
jgi:hypothetical protein